MRAKALLKLAARARRVELAKSVPDFASRIVAFTDRIPFEKGAIVAGYWPLSNEADPRLLMDAMSKKGAKLALPWISETRRQLIFRSWSPGDTLTSNRYGIGEPDRAREAVEPGLLLVPLLAFDSFGHRLGYGAGYYDRALAECSSVAVGIAYAGQEVEVLPHEAHDYPLDFVVTELGIRSFGSP